MDPIASIYNNTRGGGGVRIRIIGYWFVWDDSWSHLVYENDGRGKVISDPEQLADQLGSLSQVLLHELRAHDSQESGARVVGDGLGEQGLARSGLAVENDSLGGLDADVLVKLGVGEGELWGGGGGGERASGERMLEISS